MFLADCVSGISWKFLQRTTFTGLRIPRYYFPNFFALVLLPQLLQLLLRYTPSSLHILDQPPRGRLICLQGRRAVWSPMAPCRYSHRGHERWSRKWIPKDDHTRRDYHAASKPEAAWVRDPFCSQSCHGAERNLPSDWSCVQVIRRPGGSR